MSTINRRLAFAALTTLEHDVLLFNHTLGLEFAGMLFFSETEGGIGTALWSLSQILRDYPGSWDLYVAARDLAPAFVSMGAV